LKIGDVKVVRKPVESLQESNEDKLRLGVDAVVIPELVTLSQVEGLRHLNLLLNNMRECFEHFDVHQGSNSQAHDLLLTDHPEQVVVFLELFVHTLKSISVLSVELCLATAE
jgi:hypothetical protein